ncbi:extracellular serine/threonine protein CG31145-like [Parasteatoda tepidariorum]|uniref:extracellular serine/threonine protein CG31145-like n=1 Tax=Parasteatoda tepidariorum TaxID=114398 RepID=UPI0039BC554A
MKKIYRILTGEAKSFQIEGELFGRANHDEMSILTPLLQCCVIRLSTFNKLYAFNLGPRKLSDIMRDSLADDPVAPVLLEAHLKALDRRVAKVLDAIRQCLVANKPDLVFLDDM